MIKRLLKRIKAVFRNPVTFRTEEAMLEIMLKDIERHRTRRTLTNDGHQGIKDERDSALIETEHLRNDLNEALERLKETTDALFDAFMHEGYDVQPELEAGRWDGVRGIVELNEEFLKRFEEEE